MRAPGSALVSYPGVNDVPVQSPSLVWHGDPEQRNHGITAIRQTQINERVFYRW